MTLNRVNLERRIARALPRIEMSEAELAQRRGELVGAMRDARKQGFTLQDIADAAGLSKQRVFQLLNKEG